MQMVVAALLTDQEEIASNPDSVARCCLKPSPGFVLWENFYGRRHILLFPLPSEISQLPALCLVFPTLAWMKIQLLYLFPSTAHLSQSSLGVTCHATDPLEVEKRPTHILPGFSLLCLLLPSEAPHRFFSILMMCIL